MEAEILNTQPVSGQYPEHAFNAYGNCLWVKFTDSDLMEWCGIFGAGSGGTSKVVHFPIQSAIFVLSHGQGYWIDVEGQKLIGKTDSDDLQDVVWPPDRDFLVASNWTNIFYINPMGILWDSGRVSWDGISFESCSSSMITGHVNDLSDDECTYSLHVQERLVDGAPTFDE